MKYPNNLGIYKIYGGKYLPELLQPILNSLFKIYCILIKKKKFKLELIKYFSLFSGRPTPIYFCKNISNIINGGKIFIKREDLNLTGAHKINNSIGQILISKFLKKKRIICETGAGMHGVSTTTSCSLFNFESIIYIGEYDYKKQSINVKKIKLLGGIIFLIYKGNLKESMNEAIKDWCNNIKNTYYVIGTASGPHPYPLIVRDFQSIIGYEIFQQINFNLYKKKFLIACVGGGSNSLGFFFPYINTKLNLIAVESGGESSRLTSSSIKFGSIGVLHGSCVYILQNKYGKILNTNSISSGLNYPGVGPEISYYFYKKRIFFFSIFNNEVLYIFKLFSKIEGIIPSFETSHSLFLSFKISKFLNKKDLILINLSGRGDKDL